MSGRDEAMPVLACMWQHDDTGRTGFVDAWQIEHGAWQTLNPRHALVAPLIRQSDALALIAEKDKEVERLREAASLLARLRPYVNSLICYASTIDEHPPNGLALDVEVFFRHQSWATQLPICINDGGDACIDCMARGACNGQDPRAPSAAPDTKRCQP